MMRLVLTSLLLVGSASFAADPVKPGTMDPKMMEMMAKFKEAATPGAPHKMLADMVGKWTYTSKFWETAGGKPQESKGESTMEMILGGRWLVQKTKGEAMGQSFEGMGMTGYDNVKKQYETLWFDTMGTGVMHGQGSYDTASKTLKDKGEYSCPISENKSRTYRGEWKIKDKNNMIYSMYGTGMDGSGKEFKQMELTYKRAM